MIKMPNLRYADLLGLATAIPRSARTPGATPSSDKVRDALKEAALKRALEVGTEDAKSRNIVATTTNIPKDFDDAFTNRDDFASSKRVLEDNTNKQRGTHVYINPNMDRSVYAHELGHHVSDSTWAGHPLRSLRESLEDNPKLSAALAGGFIGLPFINSALQEGDDDLLEGIAISALVRSPILMDEVLATKNALQIMKDAGMPATWGQKARLAGGLLSYTAPAVLAGLGGNLVGNVVDDTTAIYDL